MRTYVRVVVTVSMLILTFLTTLILFQNLTVIWDMDHAMLKKSVLIMN